MPQTNILGNPKSYEEHNREYETVSGLSWCKQHYKDFEERQFFKNLGFEDVVIKESQTINHHVDIGSGAGWLLTNTSKYFSKVTGVEPSFKATEIAKILNQNQSNIEFVNLGMMEFVKQFKPVEPFFMTTSTVLSHIDNTTVREFLKELDLCPIGSKFYFGEPYGKNRNQYLWYVRNKSWWAESLPSWQLEFRDKKNDDYPFGIYGEYVGKDYVTNKYSMSKFDKLKWIISGIPSYFKYIVKLSLMKIRNK